LNKLKIDSIGDVRDLFLVLGSSIYFFGYLVLSYTFWNMKIGPLPAIDSQYFVAGLPIIIAIGIGALIVKYSHYVIGDFWPSWLHTISPQKRRYAVGFITTIFILSFATVVWADHFQDEVWIVVLMGILTLFSFLLLAYSRAWIKLTGHNLFTKVVYFLIKSIFNTRSSPVISVKI